MKDEKNKEKAEELPPENFSPHSSASVPRSKRDGTSKEDKLGHIAPIPAPFRTQQCDEEEKQEEVQEVQGAQEVRYPGAVRVKNNLEENVRSLFLSTAESNVPEQDPLTEQDPPRSPDDFHLVDAVRVDEERVDEQEVATLPPLVVAERLDTPSSKNVRTYITIGAVVVVGAIVALAVAFSQRPSTPTPSTVSVTLFGQEWNPQTTTTLDRSSRSLTGSIPTEIGQLTQLTDLFLSNNSLAGSIPTEIGQLTQLASMDLSDNDLAGSFPTEIGQLTQLALVNLYNNALTGSIPTEIGQLTQLALVNLSDNDLAGSIPTEIGQLTILKRLYLVNNALSGPVPAIALANLVNLTSLWIYNNALSGSIPSSLCTRNFGGSIRIDCVEVACDCCFDTNFTPCPKQ